MLSHLQDHGLLSTRLQFPWNFPGKNTGVGWPFLLQANLPDPGIKKTLAYPALAGEFFTTVLSGKLQF